MIKCENDPQEEPLRGDGMVTGGLEGEPRDGVLPINSSKKPPKQWSTEEEVVLAKAWVNVSEDMENRNQQPSDSFWKPVLEYFGKQIGGSDRTVHQMNSKWKSMNEKMNKFNAIYNNKLTKRQTYQTEADIIMLAHYEYRNLFKNAFPHEAGWGIVKDRPKWISSTNAHVQPPKRPKTSESNTYTTSSDAQLSSDLNEEDEGFDVEDPHRPQRSGKQPTSSSSSEQQQQRDEQLLRIVSKFTEFSRVNKEDVDDKKRHRARLEEFKAEKLRIMEEEKDERVLMMREKRKDKDMQFYIWPHDHLTGAQLNAVLARKREIAQRWGWT